MNPVPTIMKLEQVPNNIHNSMLKEDGILLLMTTVLSSF